MQQMRVCSLGREDPLEKEVATHSSTLAWRIPWIEGPGRVQSLGLQGRTWLSNWTAAITMSLTYNVVLVSGVRRHDLVTHAHISILSQTLLFTYLNSASLQVSMYRIVCQSSLVCLSDLGWASCCVTILSCTLNIFNLKICQLLS